MGYKSIAVQQIIEAINKLECFKCCFCTKCLRDMQFTLSLSFIIYYLKFTDKTRIQDKLVTSTRMTISNDIVCQQTKAIYENHEYFRSEVNEIMKFGVALRGPGMPVCLTKPNIKPTNKFGAIGQIRKDIIYQA